MSNSVGRRESLLRVGSEAELMAGTTARVWLTWGGIDYVCLLAVGVNSTRDGRNAEQQCCQGNQWGCLRGSGPIWGVWEGKECAQLVNGPWPSSPCIRVDVVWLSRFGTAGPRWSTVAGSDCCPCAWRLMLRTAPEQTIGYSSRAQRASRPVYSCPLLNSRSEEKRRVRAVGA